MCGIAGLWSAPGAAPPRAQEVEGMIRALRHRGPDGCGTHVEGAVALGHARLSIIDPEGGAQPLCNEDGSVWVSCNGEIFNHVELRRDLVSRGHRFRSASDCEVLAHLYEEEGEAFVARLNGQFAFALWDARRRRLLLARDRVGMRPLFHADVAGRLAFASEVKALFTLPALPRELDLEALASSFSWWATLPPHTPFRGVQLLPPGHVLSVGDDGRRLWRYWDWAFPDDAKADDEVLAEQLRALLTDAVRLQLQADVPVGAYLSGGLDSSIIATLAVRHCAAPLRSFSVNFDDPELDEGEHQRTLVSHLGTDHRSLHTTHRTIADAFPRLVWHAEAPIVRTAPVPMMLLADSVRRAGVKVVLTGEGADEVFAGYDLFKEASLRRYIAREPLSCRRPALLARLYPYLAHSPVAAGALTRGYFDTDPARCGEAGFAHALRLAATRRVLRFFRAEWRERLQAWNPLAALQRLLPPAFEHWQPLQRDQYVEAQTLMSGYLLAAQGDRAAMAASVEARYPFLDHRVIEFGARLPPRLKLRGLQEKVLLRRAFARDLPGSIGSRRKQPYRAPDSACFFERGRARPWVEELLSRASLDASGLFEPASVDKLVDKCAAGRAIGFADNMAFVGIVSTLLLQRQFTAGPCCVSP